MTKKIVRGLIILCAIVLVLALALTAVILIPKLTNKDDSGVETSLCSLGDITGLNYTCGDTVYHFVLTDGTWSCTEYPDYPISQNRLSRICSALGAVTATNTFEAQSSLSDYGLEPAACSVTAVNAEGDSFTLQTGSSCGDSSVYALTNTVDGVCVVGSTINTYLSYQLMEMVDAGSTPSVTEAEQVSLALEQNGKAVRLSQKDGSWYLEQPDGSSLQEENVSAVGPDGESHTLRKYLNDISNQLSDMKTSKLCSYGCTEEELAAYGLDNPLVITFTAQDGTETIYQLGNSISDSDGTTMWTLTIPDSGGVFLVPNADCWTTLFDLFAE